MTENKSKSKQIRLNKFISSSGICSRREADLHISIGNVSVNGKIVTEMGLKVSIDDDVRFDGSIVRPQKKLYILVNKPKGWSVRSNEGRGRSILKLLSKFSFSNIESYGNHSRDSSGLLLLSNDHILQSKFRNPKATIKCLFHVKLDRPLKPKHFDELSNGFNLKGQFIKIPEISYVEGSKKEEVGLQLNSFDIQLIKKIFMELKYKIRSLDCVTIGPLTKKDLPRGKWKHLSKIELSQLMML